MNVLLESPDAVPYYTDVGSTFRALGVRPGEFDWYVSDIETNLFLDGLPQMDGWIGGPQLESVLCHAGLQFLWGVFSAFPRGLRVEVLQPPVADGNSRYWNEADALKPQLPGALFELVCWDSSATILIGISAEQARCFQSTHPQAKPLRDAHKGA